MVKRRLTADDPEPPVGSVMLGEGGAWQRASDGWYATGLIDSQEWYELFEYEPTLTLVYRGPDPEAQTTWTPGDPLPLVGTIVSRPGLKPFIFDCGSWYYDNRLCNMEKWGKSFDVLRWGWGWGYDG